MIKLFALTPISDKAVLGNFYYMKQASALIFALTLVAFGIVTILRKRNRISYKAFKISGLVLIVFFILMLLSQFISSKRLSDYSKDFNEADKNFMEYYINEGSL
jgi:predicted ferric reductase